MQRRFSRNFTLAPETHKQHLQTCFFNLYHKNMMFWHFEKKLVGRGSGCVILVEDRCWEIRVKIRPKIWWSFFSRFSSKALKILICSRRNIAHWTHLGEMISEVSSIFYIIFFESCDQNTSQNSEIWRSIYNMNRIIIDL